MARIRLTSWLLLFGAVCCLTPAFQSPVAAFGGRCRPQVCIQYVYVPVEKLVYVKSEPERVGGKLHVLLLLATSDESLRGKFNETQRQVNTFHSKLDPSRRGLFRQLDGDKLKRDECLRYVRDEFTGTEVDTGRDTLLVYYNGHGSQSATDDQVQTLILQPPPDDEKMADPQAKLSRSDLREEMEKRNFRLSLLVTDCCFGPEKEEFTDATGTEAGKPKKMEMKEDVEAPPRFVIPGQYRNRVVRNLFFEHRGFLDLNAAKKGEYALAGVFTDSFIPRIEGDLTGDTDSGLTEWRDFIPKLANRVDKQFKFTLAQNYDKLSETDKQRLKDQKTQTAWLVPDRFGLVRVPVYETEEETDRGASNVPVPAKAKDMPGEPAPPSVLSAPPTSAPVAAAPAVPAPAARSGGVANVTVTVPSGTALYLDGTPTKQNGQTRYFQSPALAVGETVTYVFRAEVTTDGKAVVESKEVTLRSGDDVSIKLLGAVPLSAAR